MTRSVTGEDDPVAAYISGHSAGLLKLERNGASYTISVKAVSVIDRNKLDQCFELLEDSFQEDYRTALEAGS